ncbi:MAG TPA: hypothetical protein PLQ88_25790, partial [Blastocatellia bacterium]|nr:hypothetical protein [Blastocatellia bacterium]
MSTAFDLRGNLTLAEMTNALIVKEQTGFVRLTKLAAKTIGGQRRTEATFVDDPSVAPPPNLHLVAVQDGDNLTAVVA